MTVYDKVTKNTLKSNNESVIENWLKNSSRFIETPETPPLPLEAPETPETAKPKKDNKSDKGVKTS